jgi:hypothetical protein
VLIVKKNIVYEYNCFIKQKLIIRLVDKQGRMVCFDIITEMQHDTTS